MKFICCLLLFGLVGCGLLDFLVMVIGIMIFMAILFGGKGETKLRSSVSRAKTTKPKGRQPENMTEHELTALSEIESWKSEKPGLLEQGLDRLGRPVGWLCENIPDSARTALEKAVLGALELLKDAAYWTFSDEEIVREARSLGLNVSNCGELARFRLDQLDPLAQRYFTSNKLIAALEGAGCGLGGPALLVVDIPALFTVSLRAIQQIGSCYGFNMRDPDMAPVVLGILDMASCGDVACKAKVLIDMHIAAKALAKNWTYKKVAHRTQTGVLVQILKQSSRTLPTEIAKNVTKRKLAQVIPVLGALVGAGFNYWFLSGACKNAYMTFRSMHLTRLGVDPLGNKPVPVT